MSVFSHRRSLLACDVVVVVFLFGCIVVLAGEGESSNKIKYNPYPVLCIVLVHGNNDHIRGDGDLFHTRGRSSPSLDGGHEFHHVEGEGTPVVRHQITDTKEQLVIDLNAKLGNRRTDLLCLPPLIHANCSIGDGASSAICSESRTALLPRGTMLGPTCTFLGSAGTRAQHAGVLHRSVASVARSLRLEGIACFLQLEGMRLVNKMQGSNVADFILEDVVSLPISLRGQL